LLFNDNCIQWKIDSAFENYSEFQQSDPPSIKNAIYLEYDTS